MYFSTTNPGMKYSGVMGESKYKVLSTIPLEYVPKTILIPSSISYSSILKLIQENGFIYPFIIKPDKGERGKDVEMINDESELKSYLKGKSFDLNIQEYIDLDLEIGVLYHRIPGEKTGSITSMVQKGFLSVTGDGLQTLKSLLLQEIRANKRMKYFEKKYKNKLDTILPKGEKMYPEPIGNHCRGTTFYNANHMINNDLNQLFDKISLQIDGFYYGRFDLKVSTL